GSGGTCTCKIGCPCSSVSKCPSCSGGERKILHNGKCDCENAPNPTGGGSGPTCSQLCQARNCIDYKKKGCSGCTGCNCANLCNAGACGTWRSSCGGTCSHCSSYTKASFRARYFDNPEVV